MVVDRLKLGAERNHQYYGTERNGGQSCVTCDFGTRLLPDRVLRHNNAKPQSADGKRA